MHYKQDSLLCYNKKMREKKCNFTYILQCGDGSLYTGWTNDLEKRVLSHSQGKGGKYTRSRLPVKLVYFEEYETKEEAMKREAAIKKMKHSEKKILVKNGMSK